MNNIYLYLLIVLTVTSCLKNKDDKKNNEFEIKEKARDSLIDFNFNVKINDLEFNNPKSIIENIGTLKGKILEGEGLPHVFFSNKNHTETLKLVLFSGASDNDIYQFKVKNSKNSTIPTLSKYSNFQTEKGVKLGITKKELIRIKGKKGIKYETIDTLRYEISDYQNPTFFKKYNLPIYYELYVFKTNKINEFEFGFIYP